ncbi:hypothetical protein MNB_SM-3-1059 [hydrothermal vent metagenome]|uniref:Uncharacterized protein n=1 Tax=hydrothermal vent metagenome TaxID=652676 RepID=A0A1W1D4V4_9ZZZZ
MLYNEQLFISQAMQKCEGIPYEKIILNNPKHKTLQQLLKEPDSPFFDYIKKIGFYIQSYNTANNFQIQSTTIVTLKTTCFKVDFNEDFVTIEHIK